jgi:hypothetical protein
MTILKLIDGFVDTQEERKRVFFSQLQKLKGTLVLFRGYNESGPFKKGALMEIGDQTITFGCDVYPYREVLVAIEPNALSETSNGK